MPRWDLQVTITSSNSFREGGVGKQDFTCFFCRVSTVQHPASRIFFKLLFLSLQCSGYASALISLVTRFITILTGQTASELRGTFSRLAAFLRA